MQLCERTLPTRTSPQGPTSALRFRGGRTAIPPAVRKQCGSSAEAVRKQQRREKRSGLRPFVLFWPVEIGWFASCFWDRTTGLPNGRTEFPIGRSIGRTPIGKVRTTIKKVRYPTGKVRGQIVPKAPSIQAEPAWVSGQSGFDRILEARASDLDMWRW